MPTPVRDTELVRRSETCSWLWELFTMPLHPVASVRNSCQVSVSHWFCVLSILFSAEWVSVREKEAGRSPFLSVLSFFLLTPLSRCLFPVWSSPRPVPSCPLGSSCRPWVGGQSSAARCGGSSLTRSTYLTWCLQAVTWRFEASLMQHMSLGCWPWNPPSERAGRGNSQ